MWGQPLPPRHQASEKTTEPQAVLGYVIWCVVVTLVTIAFVELVYLPETESFADKHQNSLAWGGIGIAGLLIGAGIAIRRTERPAKAWQWFGLVAGVTCAAGGGWWIWHHGATLVPLLLIISAPVVAALVAGVRNGAGRMIVCGSFAAGVSVIVVAAHAAH